MVDNHTLESGRNTFTLTWAGTKTASELKENILYGGYNKQFIWWNLLVPKEYMVRRRQSTVRRIVKIKIINETPNRISKPSFLLAYEKDMLGFIGMLQRVSKPKANQAQRDTGNGVEVQPKYSVKAYIWNLGRVMFGQTAKNDKHNSRSTHSNHRNLLSRTYKKMK